MSPKYMPRGPYCPEGFFMLILAISSPKSLGLILEPSLFALGPHNLLRSPSRMPLFPATQRLPVHQRFMIWSLFPFSSPSFLYLCPEYEPTTFPKLSRLLMPLALNLLVLARNSFLVPSCIYWNSVLILQNLAQSHFFHEPVMFLIDHLIFLTFMVCEVRTSFYILNGEQE